MSSRDQKRFVIYFEVCKGPFNTLEFHVKMVDPVLILILIFLMTKPITTMYTYLNVNNINRNLRNWGVRLTGIITLADKKIKPCNLFLKEPLIGRADFVPYFKWAIWLVKMHISNDFSQHVFHLLEMKIFPVIRRQTLAGNLNFSKYFTANIVWELKLCTAAVSV